MEIQAKIDSIHINFNSDTELPRLNAKTLEEFGFEDRPVLLKKGVVKKNMKRHPDVDSSEYKELIGSALYRPEAVLEAHESKPYFNFVSSAGENKSSITLLQVENTGSECLEIVNMHRIDDYGVHKKREIASKIKKK